MTLDVAEAAARLRCSESHLKRLCRNRVIPATKVGRSWVLIEEDVIDWLRDKSRLPTPI